MYFQVFTRRYSECNGEFVKQFKGGSETIFLLSFAIVLLNTDLHHRCVKPKSKMSVDDFIRNLKGNCSFRLFSNESFNIFIENVIPTL
jgi:IQ motif and SEC7 domain-containing protein